MCEDGRDIERTEATEAVWNAVRLAIDDGWPVLRLVGECRHAWNKIRSEDPLGDGRLWKKILGDMKEEKEA